MLLFTKRKMAAEIARHVRRICDLTVAYEFRSVSHRRRRSRRYQRCIPVLVAPWHDGRPVVEEAQFAVTHSLCDQGMAAVLTKPFETAELCIGFWLTAADPQSQPCFFLGTRRHLIPIGGGFLNMGVEFTCYASEAHFEELRALEPLLAELGLPDKQQSAAETTEETGF
jgi:hypothetical protein